MLLNIAKAYEMLQLSESKAVAHDEVISALLRHASRAKTLGQISILDLIT